MFGAHLSRSSLGADITTSSAEVVQLFVSNPRGYQAPVRASLTDLAGLAIPVYAHLPYLVNPASQNPDVILKSVALIRATDQACAGLLAGIVVHGGQGGVGATVAEATNRWTDALAGVQLQVPLLVENTAGGNAAPGRNLDDLVVLVRRLRDLGVNSGVCYDTCHAYAAGVGELADGYHQLVDELGAVDLVHLNDSRDPLGSARDRHALLGTGTIGFDPLAALAGEAERDGCPVVLETPGDPDIWRGELDRLRDAVG